MVSTVNLLFLGLLYKIFTILFMYFLLASLNLLFCRYALDVEMIKYVTEVYPKGICSVYCVNGKDVEEPGTNFELVVVISAARLSPQNFWYVNLYWYVLMYSLRLIILCCSLMIWHIFYLELFFLLKFSILFAFMIQRIILIDILLVSPKRFWNLLNKIFFFLIGPIKFWHNHTTM